MHQRKNILVSVLIGIFAASVLGLTGDEILRNVYDSNNTALRANIVAGGGTGTFVNLAYSGTLNITGIVAVSTSATVAATTRYERCTSGSSADVTRTLPAATGTGRVINFKKIDTGTKTCIIARAGSDVILPVDSTTSVTSVALSNTAPNLTLIDAASGVWDAP